MRVERQVGLVRMASGGMPKVWRVASQSDRLRETVGSGLSRGSELRHMNIDVVFDDERASEVFGSGLLLHFRSHLAVDITLRCTLTAQGLAAANAATTDGAALMAARTDQDRTDHEVLEGDRCQLVVVGLRVMFAVPQTHTRTLTHQASCWWY